MAGRSAQVLYSHSKATSNLRGKTHPAARRASPLRKFPALEANSAAQRPRTGPYYRPFCRLLRDEVMEQLGLKSQALTDLAVDCRKLLFPDATDERFADGYAQAVTFGLLMARAKGIELVRVCTGSRTN